MNQISENKQFECEKNQTIEIVYYQYHFAICESRQIIISKNSENFRMKSKNELLESRKIITTLICINVVHRNDLIFEIMFWNQTLLNWFKSF